MSNAPRIYVRGSYIDIHDNENVYLTVDKNGEVTTRIDEAQLKKKRKRQRSLYPMYFVRPRPKPCSRSCAMPVCWIGTGNP